MTEITVCVPAYRSEKSIARTLQSLQSQSFDRYTVEIGLEPTHDSHETINHCQPFLADSRFHLEVNSEVLGWSRNISQLLDKVATPYFMILPHDDMLHSEYLRILHTSIQQRPKASVAYADMLFLGARSGEKSLVVNNDCLVNRLLTFFLAGAEAVPWRGVTRSDVLSHGKKFLHNQYDSFAVECEWALHLIQTGEIYRVALPLYFKRVYGTDNKSVSSMWARFDEARLTAALEHHRKCMLSGISTARLTDEEALSVKLACESAMLRRYLNFSGKRFSFSDRHLSRIDKIKETLGSVDPEIGSKILSRVELAISRHRLKLAQYKRAEAHARVAVSQDPAHWEALCHLAGLLLRKGAVHEALVLGSKASKFAPYASSVKQLMVSCETRLNQL